MNLLRYYFEVGGAQFDVQGFSQAATNSGFLGGSSRITSTIKTLKNSVTGDSVEVRILPGITGTSANKYAAWKTATTDYALERDVYLATRNLGLTTESAQVWLREEEAMVKFLDEIKTRLPAVADFCQGEFFLYFRLIYGYDEMDLVGGGHHFSEVLMKMLSELNAGLSTDSEPFELHFSRLQSS